MLLTVRSQDEKGSEGLLNFWAREGQEKVGPPWTSHVAVAVAVCV